MFNNLKLILTFYITMYDSLPVTWKILQNFCTHLIIQFIYNFTYISTLNSSDKKNKNNNWIDYQE